MTRNLAAHQVYIDQPVGTGFSQGKPNITNEFELAYVFSAPNHVYLLIFLLIVTNSVDSPENVGTKSSFSHIGRCIADLFLLVPVFSTFTEFQNKKLWIAGDSYAGSRSFYFSLARLYNDPFR